MRPKWVLWKRYGSLGIERLVVATGLHAVDRAVGQDAVARRLVGSEGGDELPRRSLAMSLERECAEALAQAHRALVASREDLVERVEHREAGSGMELTELAVEPAVAPGDPPCVEVEVHQRAHTLGDAGIGGHHCAALADCKRLGGVE